MPLATTPAGKPHHRVLVVITIVGLLMALLIPAVNGVREASRETTCGRSRSRASPPIYRCPTIFSSKFTRQGVNSYAASRGTIDTRFPRRSEHDYSSSGSKNSAATPGRL